MNKETIDQLRTLTLEAEKQDTAAFNLRTEMFKKMMEFVDVLDKNIEE